jgi:hypothetical protein
MRITFSGKSGMDLDAKKQKQPECILVVLITSEHCVNPLFVPIQRFHRYSQRNNRGEI